MATDAKIAANQRNAQLSTGPTSEAGRAKSSLNAVKTGLTGRTVLLPSDDAALYEQHLQSFLTRWNPVGDEERNFVQSLADTEWRLARIPSLEAGIYALGRLEFAELFPNEDEITRKQLIESKILLTYQRQLNNLSIQENRLRRHREKDTATLKELQNNRERAPDERLDKAARKYVQEIQLHNKEVFDPAKFGFEFPIESIEDRAGQLRPDLSMQIYMQELLRKGEKTPKAA